MSLSFYERLMRMPVARRQEVATAAGVSLGYVQKQIYVSEDRTPRFAFATAVALDKASNGDLPFITATTEVDWDFVRRRLNTLHRQGAL